MFKHFSKRLQEGIQARVDERLFGYEKASGQKPDPITVNVANTASQRFAVYCGGSVLAS